MRTRVGYAGGTTPHPTYDRIGDHTETVEVDFDPTQTSFGDLLDAYFSSGGFTRAAWSRQYAAIIFYHDDAQRHAAEGAIARRGKVFVELKPYRGFTLAEDYHQKYYLQGSALGREFAGRDLVRSTAAARANGYLGGYGSPAQLQADLGRLGLSEKGRQQLLKAAKAGRFVCH